MRIFLIACISILILSSCGAWSSKKDIAVNPYPSVPLSASTGIALPTPSQSGSSYVVKGTEPFWSVTVKPGIATYSRPWETKAVETVFQVTEENTKSTVMIKSIKWDFFLTLTKGNCSDGMSDTKYEYTSTILVGAESLSGCAFKVN